MYKLFVVEDDRGIAEAIRKQAEAWDYQVVLADDFRSIMKEFQAAQPHLVLLDVALPYFDGYHWCREIRKVSSVPVVFISSAADNMNIVMAMNMGADEFISKPFDGSVLIAKIQAMLRRSYDFASPAPALECRGAVLNTGDGTLTFQGQRIDLTKNEFRILQCLMENCGKTVSREHLMEKLWETDLFIDDNTLTVNVNRLRKKLDHAGLSEWITTRFGVGYLIEKGT